MVPKLLAGLQILSMLGGEGPTPQVPFLCRKPTMSGNSGSTQHVLYYKMLPLRRHDLEQPTVSRTTQVPGVGHQLCHQTCTAL